MKSDDAFEQWKSSRTAIDVPADFADRVMGSIEQWDAAHRRRHVLQALVLAVLASRLGRVAIWSLACAACVARVGAILALFVPA